jgi:hypothetical protein
VYGVGCILRVWLLQVDQLIDVVDTALSKASQIAGQVRLLCPPSAWPGHSCGALCPARLAYSRVERVVDTRTLVVACAWLFVCACACVCGVFWCGVCVVFICAIVLVCCQAAVLRAALEEVGLSREVIAYTYIEGYFMSERHAKELEVFNYLQQMLDSHTDHLQELVEQRAQQVGRGPGGGCCGVCVVVGAAVVVVGYVC